MNERNKKKTSATQVVKEIQRRTKRVFTAHLKSGIYFIVLTTKQEKIASTKFIISK